MQLGDCGYEGIVGGAEAPVTRAWHPDGDTLGFENGFAFRAGDLPAALFVTEAGWYEVCDLMAGEVALCIPAESRDEAIEKAQKKAGQIRKRHALSVKNGRERVFLQQLNAICCMYNTDDPLTDMQRSRPVHLPDAVLKAPFILRPSPDTWLIRTNGYTTCLDGRPYGLHSSDGGRWEVTDLRTGVPLICGAPQLTGMNIRQVLEYVALHGRLLLQRLEPHMCRLETEMVQFTLAGNIPGDVHFPPEWREWYLEAGLMDGAELIDI